MKATELRIGNYVFIDGQAMAITAADILEIARGDISLYMPIPIGDEESIKLLIKYMYNISIHYSYDNKEDEISISDEDDDLEFNIFLGENYVDISTCLRIENVNHFHQLQNLFFALTGRELTSHPVR